SIPETLRPIIVLVFNQRVSPEAILAKTTVSGSGSVKALSSSQLQLVPDADALKQYEYQLNNALLPRTWFAFKPTIDLNKNTQYTVTVNSGCPSAEGPLTNPSNQTFSFSTYPPLTLVSYWPDHRHNGKSMPGQSWNMNFSNKLAHGSITKSTLLCSPP